MDPAELVKVLVMHDDLLWLREVSVLFHTRFTSVRC